MVSLVGESWGSSVKARRASSQKQGYGAFIPRFWVPLCRPHYNCFTKCSPATSISGLGTFVKPTSTYAAAWAYPQKIMKGFARSDADWTWQGGKSIREKAAWGWLSRSADMVVLIATPSGLLTDASLRVHHIGKSGPFYRIVRGHGTLPVESLMQARPDWPLEVNRTWRYRL